MRIKNILVVNGGSSSDKISLFELANNSPIDGPAQGPIWQTEFDFPSGDIDSIDWEQLLTKTLQPILNNKEQSIDIVGHRIVHGGGKYTSATLITDEVKKDIEAFIPLAPLHNKVGLAQINAMEKLLPNAKQFAVFDTAFHHTLPDTAAFYPVPYEWHEKYNIRRFGFHGINHQYCSQQAARELKKDLSSLSLISCHLGSGCSLTAIENGKSVNTTMGFTPLEGLMMATRSGSIDPGILIYLLKNKKVTVEELEKELNKNSGIKGIAKISDMKTLIGTMQSNNDQSKLAQLAFDMFIAHLRAGICAMRASLSKLDAIIFTGGIGENSALIREKTMKGLEFIGKPTVLVIKAREGLEIAEQCLQLLIKP